jgi:hypothetical protein
MRASPLFSFDEFALFFKKSADPCLLSIRLGTCLESNAEVEAEDFRNPQDA